MWRSMFCIGWSSPETPAIIDLQAPVAQLDRASDYGSGGWGFKSLRACQPTLATWVLWSATPSPASTWGLPWQTIGARHDRDIVKRQPGLKPCAVPLRTTICLRGSLAGYAQLAEAP